MNMTFFGCSVMNARCSTSLIGFYITKLEYAFVKVEEKRDSKGTQNISL